MKSFLRIASLAALVLTFAGCCACRHGAKKSRLPLAGTRWSLVQLGGKTLQNDPERFTVVFRDEERRLAGVGACNRLTDSYETDGKRTLTIGRIAATRMACPDLELEGTFIRTLERVVRYDMDGDMLLLFSDEGLTAVLQGRP